MKSLLALLVLLAGPALADSPCPMPDDIALHDLDLPAARKAVAAGRLVVLTIGGAATAGVASRGAEFTYPARLEARLRDRLPGVAIAVEARATPRRSAKFALHAIDSDLAESGARLVIWSAGAMEAGAGLDVDTLAETLGAGIAKIRSAGADLILMDLQYAPSIARVVNLAPYREAVLRVGETYDVAVLDRYEMMRIWNDDGVLDLDATGAEERVRVARQLFDCLAAALADGIVKAVR